MTNPWLNISISDTIADCDKSFLQNLPESLLSRFEFRTLPEPFHGNPESIVYILSGNPAANAIDLNYINQPSYEKEIVEELKHDNTDFLWLRQEESIVDSNGIPYPAYKWWKNRTKELRIGTLHPNLFCIEAFPYHSKNAGDFMKIENLPSNEYTDDLIRDAISKEKYIILMRCRSYWYKRIPELIGYHKILTLSSQQAVYLTKNNLRKNEVFFKPGAWCDFVELVNNIGINSIYSTNNLTGFISTDPLLNQPKMAICSRCCKVFKKAAWSGVYSTTGGQSVVLCPKCAKEELAEGRINQVYY